MAYFPKERILVEADVYSPGAAVQPYAANLLENIKKRNLRVDASCRFTARSRRSASC